MSVSRTLLGLLEPRPQHGYTLRQRYDEWFGAARPVKSAQVYATLQRLARDGYADLTGVEAGEGPDRRVCTSTRTSSGSTARRAGWTSSPPRHGSEG